MDLNNMSPAYQRFATSCSEAAYAIALGNAALTDKALDFAALCESDETLAPLDVTPLARTVYVDLIRVPAEIKADDAGKPLKPQTDKSRNSQVSKLAAYAKLGFRGRENPAVLPVLRDAARMCAAGYTPTTKIATALVAHLVKAPQASRADLEAVVAANLPVEKATTPLAFVEAMEKRLTKGRDGTEDEAGILAACLDADPAMLGAYTKALQGLTDLRVMLAKLEDPLV